ncbi:hypothetical protein [Psychrobacter sp. AOP7-B1-24]|uniref:hypothetical protein n=1 Tax=Psychrobacter sp. AOP7-B1-24 TaxID=3457645 RepID=UPI00402B67DC
MDLERMNDADSIHWLKVAMRQAQSDIKKANKRIFELEREIDVLNKKPKALITPLDFNGNPFPTK